jgi:hypothetical protein
MFPRNLYRTVGNALMILFITFMAMKFVGMPIIRWYQISHAIKIAKKRLNLLQADMDENTVKTTLGLSDYITVGLGGGGSAAYWTSFKIDHGHNLEIVSHWTSNAPSLISVSVDDKTWKPQDDSTNR